MPPTAPFTDADHPADPYPGARPDCSFLHVDDTGWPLAAAGGTPWAWRLTAQDTDLDGWLTERGEPGLDERIPVLAYGSNRCPAKIGWLRHSLGLSGPVVVLRAECSGLSAVWASALRVRDSQRPATLMAAPGVTETHAVWLATPQQVRVLDVCEGRGERYRLARLDSGQVRLEDGSRVDGVLGYVAAAPIRHPLYTGGRPVPCSETSQLDAQHLVGEPGPDGLAARTVSGPPAAADWPPRLFVYGTLAPGESAWPLVRPLTDGEPWRAALPGTRYDPGRGYPALRFDGTDPVPGWVLPLANPAGALRSLDAYEGPEYARVRVRLADGTVCWTYRWRADTAGLPHWM